MRFALWWMNMSMTFLRLLGISILLCFLCNVELPAAAQTTLQPETEHQESITGRAAQAKANGKREVTFPSVVTSYPSLVSGLTHALSEFTVVVGTR